MLKIESSDIFKHGFFEHLIVDSPYIDTFLFESLFEALFKKFEDLFLAIALEERTRLHWYIQHWYSVWLPFIITGHYFRFSRVFSCAISWTFPSPNYGKLISLLFGIRDTISHPINLYSSQCILSRKMSHFGRYPFVAAVSRPI